MQNPHGQVVSVSVGLSGRKVVVEVDSALACKRCASGKGCGAGLFGAQSGERRVEATVIDDLDIDIGDLVSIVLEPQNILRAAVIVYGYPLAGAVMAAIAAFGLGYGDVAGAAAALGGLVTGILIAKIRLGNARCLRDFTPVVVDRLPSVPD